MDSSKQRPPTAEIPITCCLCQGDRGKRLRDLHCRICRQLAAFVCEVCTPPEAGALCPGCRGSRRYATRNQLAKLQNAALRGREWLSQSGNQSHIYARSTRFEDLAYIGELAVAVRGAQFVDRTPQAVLSVFFEPLAVELILQHAASPYWLMQLVMQSAIRAYAQEGLPISPAIVHKSIAGQIELCTPDLAALAFRPLDSLTGVELAKCLLAGIVMLSTGPTDKLIKNPLFCR